MFKKTAIAATTALALSIAALAPATTANAGDVSFGVVIGDGHGNGFFFGNNGGGNPGWGNPGWNQPVKMTCFEARQHIKSHGFKFIQKIECKGKVYTFKAKAGFSGPKKIVKVHAYNGNIWI